ncbi:hypothetical protein FPQ14_00905 [Gilliamella apicola]|uniref:Uncharacterized protein n=1 Tax=Gilliamella apicola TaxID=1196095 RepID=A0A556RSH8_9GAMM|nr:hypothetical protein [Gilliamella apicola]TSJ91857.1 hypothetical protein FPQ14_00905 [Gilliamella apicola]
MVFWKFPAISRYCLNAYFFMKGISTFLSQLSTVLPDTFTSILFLSNVFCITPSFPDPED